MSTKQEMMLAKLDEIEASIRALGWWQDAMREEIRGGPIGAFGQQNMAFSEWLQWTFLPNARERVPEDDLPGGSMVATYARRDLDGVDEADPLIDLLWEFDCMVGDTA